MHIMKYSFLIVAFLGFTTVHSQNWVSNFDQALETAVSENKPVILVFSGSDWCAPCIKLDKSVWQTDAFKAYAKDHYVLYKADFPRKKANQPNEGRLAKNKELAEKYNPKGHFPLVLVLDANGKTLGTTGFKNLGADAYVSHLNSFLK